VYAFESRLKVFTSDAQSKFDVISFGDSHVEREAIRIATRNLVESRTKSVKFAERPSMEQLRRQIELINNCFHYIHGHDGDLDLQLTITEHNPQSPSSPTASSPATSNSNVPATSPSSASVASSSDNEMVRSPAKSCAQESAAAAAAGASQTHLATPMNASS